MRWQPRYFGYGITLLLVGWLAFRLLRPATHEVEVATATRGPLRETVTEEGMTRVRHRHLISAPVPGRLERLSFEVGDLVEAGEVVAQLAPLPLDARSREQAVAALAAATDRQRMAEAGAEEARTALELTRRDRQRAEQLAVAGAVSNAELERLQLGERAREREVAAAVAQADAAAHDVEAARATLAAAGSATGARTLTLTCPIGGRVLAIPERSERTVLPGETLLEIGDPTTLEIVVDLLSTDAVRVMPGQRLLLTGWGEDTTLEGAVRRVDPGGFTKVSALGVEEQRVNVIGDFLVPPERLGDRFRLDVHVVLWEAPDVLKVPSSALFRRGEAWALFVIEEGRARERVVQVDHESTSESEITGGLSEGAVIIRHPSDQVREGSRVRALVPP